MKCSDKEAVAAYRRVLKLVNIYLRKQKQDLLITDGRSLMTWGEIRQHIKGAVRLHHPLIARPKSGRGEGKKEG